MDEMTMVLLVIGSAIVAVFDWLRFLGAEVSAQVVASVDNVVSTLGAPRLVLLVMVAGLVSTPYVAPLLTRAQARARIRAERRDA